MELTGKCREDFNIWLDSKYAYNINDWQKSKLIIKEAFILEFFESVGIYIDKLTYDFQIQIWDYRFSEPETCITLDSSYDERSERYSESVEKCNELYNLPNENTCQKN